MKYTGERFIPEICDGEMEIEHLQRYEFARNQVKGMSVLDSACGEGYGASLLSETAVQVVGLDLDDATISQAKIKYDKTNLSFVVGSIDHLPFTDQTFDAVISFETLEHVNEEVQLCFFKEIKRVLKHNGLLIISTPNKAIYTDLVHGTNKFHLKELYTHEFSELIKKFFCFTRLYSQYPLTGYFITHESSKISISVPSKVPDKSRYIIAVCSDERQKVNACTDTAQTLHFDDRMYYFLYQKVHDLEKDILLLKEESSSFTSNLEASIEKQKSYITHLEADLEKQKEQIIQSDHTMNQQRDYIALKENDIIEQKEYINHLEKDLLTQKKEIEYFVASLEEQKEYIRNLENQIQKLGNENNNRRGDEGDNV